MTTVALGFSLERYPQKRAGFVPPSEAHAERVARQLRESAEEGRERARTLAREQAVLLGGPAVDAFTGLDPATIEQLSRQRNHEIAADTAALRSRQAN